RRKLKKRRGQRPKAKLDLPDLDQSRSMRPTQATGSITETEVTMFQCHVCGGTASREDFVNEVFTIEGRRVLVEHIPADICERCGEATFPVSLPRKSGA